MKRGLGVSHCSQEWDGKDLGRLKMKHENGCGCFMVPKSGVGWRFNAHLNNNLLLLRCFGKGNLPHEMGLKSIWVKSLCVKSQWVKSLWVKVYGYMGGKSAGERLLVKGLCVKCHWVKVYG